MGVIGSSLGDITNNGLIERERNERVHDLTFRHAAPQRNGFDRSPQRMRGRTIAHGAAEWREVVVQIARSHKRIVCRVCAAIRITRAAEKTEPAPAVERARVRRGDVFPRYAVRFEGM
ncbi:uncharacterized protein AruCF_4550 [Achromobacter ruhlandii]|nr:uncharacterized protein AruCF_4550 [Achromobacter ruhlandii]